MKYIGSKRLISRKILPIILKGRKAEQWYIEPFAGGMNMICEVGGNRIANDVNYYLIKMWEQLIKGWNPSIVSRAEYDDCKKNKEKYPPYFVGWCGFNCSYSGKWFGGYAGECLTKIGSIRNYQDEAIRNIKKQVEKLYGVQFANKSYFELNYPENSVIYCDPPYSGTTKYSNTIDHDVFWEWVRNMTRSGHSVFVSEYIAPTDFRSIWKCDIKSSLSANGVGGCSKVSTEKLFIYEL